MLIFLLILWRQKYLKKNERISQSKRNRVKYNICLSLHTSSDIVQREAIFCTYGKKVKIQHRKQPFQRQAISESYCVCTFLLS